MADVRVQTWQDPPPKRSSGGRPRGRATDGGRHSALISELQQNPGKWALLDHGDRSPTSVYSELADLKGFEFTTRSGENALRIYGRYVADEQVAS